MQCTYGLTPIQWIQHNDCVQGKGEGQTDEVAIETSQHLPDSSTGWGAMRFNR